MYTFFLRVPPVHVLAARTADCSAIYSMILRIRIHSALGDLAWSWSDFVKKRQFIGSLCQVAMLLYWALLLDLTIFSMQISAPQMWTWQMCLFDLICCLFICDAKGRWPEMVVFHCITTRIAEKGSDWAFSWFPEYERGKEMKRYKEWKCRHRIRWRGSLGLSENAGYVSRKQTGRDEIFWFNV